MEDAKRVHGYKSIADGFRKAKKQGAKIVIIDFDRHLKGSVIHLRKVVSNLTHRKQDFENKSISKVYIVHNAHTIQIDKNSIGDRAKLEKIMKEKGL